MIYKTSETERLVIQPITKNDSEFIFQLFNTPNWLNFIGNRNIKSVEDAEQYIESKMIPQLKRLGYSNYTLIRKEGRKNLD